MLKLDLILVQGVTIKLGISSGTNLVEKISEIQNSRLPGVIGYNL